MPEIPLFNAGQSIKTGNVPQMPMDTERRPRADFRGIIAGINRIASGGQAMADAAMQPTLDPKMFSGLERGQQALAEGIMSVGGMMQKYAEKRQDAINQQDIGRARAAMQAEYMTHLAERDKANPRTWNADWTKRAETLRQRYGADKNLSQFAKDSILGDLDGFNVTTSARLLFDSSEAIHRENGDMIFSQIDQAKRDKNIPQVVALRAEAVAGGHQSQGRADIEAWNDVNEVKALQRADAIAEDPGKAWKILQLPVKDRPPEWQDMGPAQDVEAKSAALGSLFNRKRDLMTVFKSQIASGAIQNIEHVQNFAATYGANILDQGDYEVMKGWLSGAAPINTSVDWNRAYQAVQSLDLDRPEVEVREEEARLKMMFERKFDGPMLQEATQMLEDRIKQRDDLAASDRRDLVEVAEREFKRGAFGPITKAKTTPDGKFLADKQKDLVIPDQVGMLWWKRPGTPADAKEVESFTFEKEADPAAFEMAQRRMREAVQKVDAWAKGEKIPPTREERFKKLYQYMGTAVNAAEAENYINGGVNFNSSPFPSGTVKDAEEAYKKAKQ